MTQLSKLRILLVEDEPLIATLLEELLQEMGHDVCATEATEEKAIAAARRESPDLMIVDFRLRKGSGVSAVAAILRDGFVPHIFTSGDDMRNQTLDPAAVILRKPFLEVDLLDAIHKAMTSPAPAVPP